MNNKGFAMNKGWIALMVFALALASRASAARTLITELDIPAPAAEVWNAFTTDEGFMTWAVPKAEFDFRVGGEMRTSYNPDSNLHDEHTIINKVLAYEPKRMLAMQNVQAPKGFANAHLFQETWSVIYFEPTAPDRTHVRIVGMGYGEGPEWDDIYNKFKVGNAYTLEKLREKFAPSPPEGADDVESSAKADEGKPDALAILSQMAGGEWIHESTQEDGGVFRVRNVMERGPDGECIVGRGFLGDAEGMYEHGATLVYREPVTRRTRFLSVNEDGSVSQGEIRALDEHTVEWDWNIETPEGAKSAFRVHSHFPGDDQYTFKLWRQGDDGVWLEMVDLAYTRVEKAPQEFYRMKSAAHE